jgi:peptidoglycan hydrolase-like protein with peptidoglycan-binding domain
MSKKHWLTAGTALALGVVWTAAPALAQQTTGEKIENKVERAKDKAETKAERTADKAENKAERAKDKAEAKADRAADKTDSTVDRAKDKARDMKDKAKDKTSELTEKAKDKTAELKDKMDNANAMHDRQEVMAMQRSLRQKGYNPGPEDGIIGPRTRAALADYQRREGLTPSGNWDDDTKSRLGTTAMAVPDKTAVSASPADPRGEKPSVNTPPPTKRQTP